MNKVTKKQLVLMDQECLSNNINKTARIITRLYDEKLRKHGYKAKQIQTLFRIAFYEPMPINVLAEKSDMDRTTALRNCQILEKEGLIIINIGDDRRYRMIELTSKGWRTVNMAYEVWQEQQSEIEQILGKTDLKNLTKMLRIAGKKCKE